MKTAEQNANQLNTGLREIVHISVGKILPHPLNEVIFVPEPISVDFAENIRLVGIIHPCVVVPTEKNRYVMLSGHRRWQAAMKNGQNTIPCEIVDVAESDQPFYLFSSNIGRGLKNAWKIRMFKQAKQILRQIKQGVEVKADADETIVGKYAFLDFLANSKSLGLSTYDAVERAVGIPIWSQKKLSRIFDTDYRDRLLDKLANVKIRGKHLSKKTIDGYRAQWEQISVAVESEHISIDEADSLVTAFVAEIGDAAKAKSKAEVKELAYREAAELKANRDPQKYWTAENEPIYYSVEYVIENNTRAEPIEEWRDAVESARNDRDYTQLVLLQRRSIQEYCRLNNLNYISEPERLLKYIKRGAV